jgi:hypothetical protein
MKNKKTRNKSNWSCQVLSGLCLVLSRLILPCLIVSCLILSCLELSCLVLSCLVLSWLGLAWLGLPFLCLVCVLSCLSLVFSMILCCLALSRLSAFVLSFEGSNLRGREEHRVMNNVEVSAASVDYKRRCDWLGARFRCLARVTFGTFHPVLLDNRYYWITGIIGYTGQDKTRRGEIRQGQGKTRQRQGQVQPSQAKPSQAKPNQPNPRKDKTRQDKTRLD